MIATGLLSGKGVFDPTYLTVVGAAVAPGGGDKIGTLTIKGDTILASASARRRTGRTGTSTVATTRRRRRRATPERSSMSLRDTIDRRFTDSKPLADLRDRCVGLRVQARDLPLLVLT